MRRNKKKELAQLQDSQGRVIFEEAPFNVREAYKALRTNLIFSLPEEGGKVILLTSANPGEGKSTNCLNVAIAFAETGAKVCIVDCDLRKPNVARLMRQKGSPGLTNVLVHLNTIDEVVVESKYENLDCVYSGDIPPDPTELLASPQMDKVLEYLRDKYDYVFIDTPPVNVVTDASLLAGKASGVVVVARYGSTGKKEFSEAIQQLNFVKAKILGALMNCTEPEGRKRYGKRYGHKYYRRGYGYGYGYGYGQGYAYGYGQNSKYYSHYRKDIKEPSDEK